MISYDKYEKPIPRSSWESDSCTSKCNICHTTIKSTLIFKSNKHHCRFCGKIICDGCSQNKSNKHRICDLCVTKNKGLQNAFIKLSSSSPDFDYHHLLHKIIIKLSGSPIDPIKISDHEFMFISDRFDDTLHLYYYNTIENQWKQKDEKMFEKFSMLSATATAFNTNTKELYSIFGKTLTRVHLKNKSKAPFKITSTIYWPKCIFINDKLHIIGGVKAGGGDSNHHFVWNDNEHKLIRKWTFKNFDILRDFGLIFLENKQRLYLFGGVIRTENQMLGRWPFSDIKSDCIFMYDTDESSNGCIWKQLNVKMPYKAYVFAIITCKNDKYILLFIAARHDDLAEIYIFDVNKEIFTKSSIQCPIPAGDIKAFVNDYGSNFYKMNVLLGGYIHSMNATKSFDYIPRDVVNLIALFMCSEGEYVYVFGYNGMWKISINYILKFSLFNR